MMQQFLASESELSALAAEWISSLGCPALVYLSGDLGAGKSSFVRAAIAALGFTGKVKSPTFSLLETYHVNDKVIHHMDLYRLADPEELEYLGFRDLLGISDYLFIEWPEQAEGFLPPPTHQIRLAYGNADQQPGREITINDLNAT